MPTNHQAPTLTATSVLGRDAFSSNSHQGETMGLANPMESTTSSKLLEFSSHREDMKVAGQDVHGLIVANCCDIPPSEARIARVQDGCHRSQPQERQPANHTVAELHVHPDSVQKRSVQRTQSDSVKNKLRYGLCKSQTLHYAAVLTAHSLAAGHTRLSSID